MASESDTPGPAPVVGQRGVKARRHAQRVRRFYALTAASTVVPGLGLIPSRRRTGIAMVAVFVAGLLALGGYALVRGVASSVISVGVSSRTLMVAIPVIVVAAAVWIWGIVTTARDNMPEDTHGRPKIAMVLFTVLASLLIFAPAVQGMRYAVIQRSVLNTVFDTIRPEGAAAPSGKGGDPWAETERVNIMLVGSDAAENRSGVRPDAIIVASVDPQTGDTILFGIPRNLQDIPFSEDNPLSEQYPDGYDCGNQCLMEFVWELGEDNSELFESPNPGLSVTKDAASQVLGLQVDYTAVVDLDGFKQLVDAMGGVTVDVQERVCIGCHIEDGEVVGTTGWIEPGVQHLDGYHALWYSRSRAGSEDGDFSRMRRQRCMVGALLNQVNPRSMVMRYPALAQTLEENVRVDIPQQDLDEWAELVLRIQKKGKIQSLPLTNQNVDVDDPDYEEIHQMVDEAIDPPKKTPAPSPTESTPSPTTETPEEEAPVSPSPSSSTPEDELSDINATC